MPAAALPRSDQRDRPSASPVRSVIIPGVVAGDLSHPRTPAAVRTWLASSPSWLASQPPPAQQTSPFPKLDDGEQGVIALAQALGTELILMDDRAGVVAARSVGLEATGTLGVLLRAADLGLIDVFEAVSRLRATNFRCRPTLLDELMAWQRRKPNAP